MPVEACDVLDEEDLSDCRDEPEPEELDCKESDVESEADSSSSSVGVSDRGVLGDGGCELARRVGDVSAEMGGVVSKLGGVDDALSASSSTGESKGSYSGGSWGTTKACSSDSSSIFGTFTVGHDFDLGPDVLLCTFSTF